MWLHGWRSSGRWLWLTSGEALGDGFSGLRRRAARRGDAGWRSGRLRSRPLRPRCAAQGSGCFEVLRVPSLLLESSAQFFFLALRSRRSQGAGAVGMVLCKASESATLGPDPVSAGRS